LLKTSKVLKMGRTEFKIALIVLITSAIYIIEKNFSIVILSLYFMVLGAFILKLAFKKDNYTTSLKLFFLFYIIYVSYSYIVYKTYIDDPLKDYFIGIDSIKYYEFTSSVLNNASSIPHGFKLITETFEYSDVRGYLYIHFIVGYLAESIGSNDYYVQQLIIVFFTSLIIVFFYNITLIFLKRNEAKIVTITYGLFGHIFVYSSTLLRDIHISLLFVLGFFILFTKRSLLKLFILILINLLVFLFRTEHAIYFMIFVIYYIYLLLKDNNRKFQIVPLFLISTAIFSYFLINYNVIQYWGILTNTTARYAEYANESADQSGFGAALLNLPPGISEFSRAAFSQILPFPIFYGVNTSRGVIKLLAFPIMFSAIIWITTWSFIIYGIRKKGLRKFIPNQLKVVFFLSILLIIGASSGSGDIRRLIPIYPIIILTSSVFYFKLTIAQRKGILIKSLIFIFGLHLIYFVLKF